VDEDDAVDAPAWYWDADGDGYGDAGVSDAQCFRPSGYVADGSDCDDAHSDAWPGADEYCDGYDNDCEGDVDEDDAVDASTWFQDADGDGYGDSTVNDVECTAPSGYIADGGDCDDADQAVNPAADEYCDGVDNDCDGTTDESDSLDVRTWYLDADSDGYGDQAMESIACNPPVSHVADATDCDDSDATIYPGAEDTWYDGVDSDCDGGSDYDADGDGYLSDAYGGTDCDDEDAGKYPGISSWLVPDDFATIQEAIDASCTLDSIQVSAGNYTENIDFGYKAIDLIGVDGPEDTTIDGGYGGDPVITIDGVEGGSIQGFTITNGLASAGGGIYVMDSLGLAITDVIVSANAASGMGGGIYIEGSGEIAISDCVVQENLAASAGAGIAARLPMSDASYSVVIDGCDVNLNTSSNAGGGIYLGSMIDASVSNTDVSWNSGLQDGGMTVTADEYGTVELTNVDICDNDVTDDDGGLELRAPDYATIFLTDVVICRNQAADERGALYLHSSGTSASFVFDGVTISDNYAGDPYGGVYAALGDSSSFELTDVEFSGNWAGRDWGAMRVVIGDSSTLLLSDVTVSGNYASSEYAGLALEVDDDATVTGSGLSITDNESSYPGLWAEVSDSGSIVLTNVVIAGNSECGAHLTTSSASDFISITNASVVGNSGSGIYADSYWMSQIELVNVVAAENGGYGVENAGSYEPILECNDIYGNDGGDYYGFSGGDPTGTDGNLSQDPEFVSFSMAMDVETWDLHLSSSSTLVDAGEPTLQDPDGTISDIGAYGGPESSYEYYEDEDADGMFDGWEALHGLDPTADDSADDPDGDGLCNEDELLQGTDPFDGDTDGDGIDDGDEISGGTSPLGE